MERMPRRQDLTALEQVKMNKLRKILAIVIGMLLMTLAGCSGSDPSYHAEGADKYNKAYIAEVFHGDLDSNLSLFPDELNADDADYEAILSSSLFDTDARIILRCNYGAEEFEREVTRLQGLSITLKSDDEQFTNDVLYDEESYYYPSYITIDGFKNTYEYALIDTENCSIVYIYLAYPDIDSFPVREYLKKDLEAYSEENTLNRYSMYSHSFDNGASWVEFDDQPAVRDRIQT